MIKNLVIMSLFSAMALGSSLQAACGSCCPDCPPGPIGAQGPQGAQGAAGPAGNVGPQGNDGSIGPQGVQGVAGTAGPQGAIGPQGVQGTIGPQGPVGPMGPCCPVTIPFANVFSNVDQVIAPAGNPGDIVLFNAANAVSASAFDISAVGTTGQIVFLKNGIYSLDTLVEGLLADFPFPVPVWAFGLFLDGVFIPGSNFASFSLSPDIILTHAGAAVITQVNAGQVLTLQNTSTGTVDLRSSAVGSTVPITSAAINITLLQAL